MSFTFEALVTNILGAFDNEQPETEIRQLLHDAVADPDQVLSATPADGAEDEMLYEDDRVSIWWCKFRSDVLIPAHEHKMKVLIAGYGGAEKQILFTHNDEGLHFKDTVTVHPGEVISLDENAIHSVVAENDAPAYSIHVYFGPLSKITRGLFDWDTGVEYPLTMDKFEELTRSKHDFPFTAKAYASERGME